MCFPFLHSLQAKVSKEKVLRLWRTVQLAARIQGLALYRAHIGTLPPDKGYIIELYWGYL